MPLRALRGGDKLSAARHPHGKNAMRNGAFWLCGFYLVAKTYARYWLYKTVHARPAVTRQNDALKLIELAGLTALVGAFFFMLNHANMLPAVVVIAVLLLYDWIICRVFLNIEVKRLCAKSARWHKSDARRHVRKRAETGLFH